MCFSSFNSIALTKYHDKTKTKTKNKSNENKQNPPSFTYIKDGVHWVVAN